MRIIIYTGKGGVGKTSMAAATAMNIASQGKRVLIMSTDQAHSLGDSFDMELTREPIQITDNLFGLEIDTVYESEKSWGNLKGYFKSLLSLNGDGGIEVEELLVFPGLEELFSMFKILEIYEKNLFYPYSWLLAHGSYGSGTSPTRGYDIQPVDACRLWA